MSLRPSADKRRISLSDVRTHAYRISPSFGRIINTRNLPPNFEQEINPERYLNSTLAIITIYGSYVSPPQYSLEANRSKRIDRYSKHILHPNLGQKANRFFFFNTQKTSPHLPTQRATFAWFSLHKKRCRPVLFSCSSKVSSGRPSCKTTALQGAKHRNDDDTIPSSSVNLHTPHFITLLFGAPSRLFKRNHGVKQWKYLPRD